ncbi:MAG: response regulator [Rhodospirillales bacterium]
MGVYNLERLTFLLVDDNRFVLRILQEVLKTLGAGQVITAENGVEAIEFLGAHHGPYGCPVDIIISDLVMAPIDGHLLLKWVRQGKDSPNRFMPFIMMSGAADSEHVEKARDGGASEFLAKPFSAQTVCNRILEVIDYPRQFVATRDYFGPDRHRRSEGIVPDDRRRITEKDATVVYSSDRVRRPSKDGDVYLFRLPNKLKEKVGALGMSPPGELPLRHLQAADEHLERKGLEFHDWALGYLATLSSICDRALEQSEDQRARHFKNINLLAHELRGQGGTFGYPIITQVGEMLYKTTQAPCPTEDRAVTVIKAHVDTMRSVFRDKVTGDGGNVGVELLQDLKKAIRKYTFEEPRAEAEAQAKTDGAGQPVKKPAGVDPIAAPYAQKPQTGT